MHWRRHAERAAFVLVVSAAVLLVAGQALGQPILLGYVTSESMEPTLEAGDGFVAVPAPVAGEVEPGDVVVYDAERLHDGGLVTHRVVAETDRGYVTKGDGNPFTDQDGPEPRVTDDQIVATALQVNGRVVVIPGVGTAIETLDGGLAGVQRTLAVAFGTRLLLGTSGVGLLLVAVGGLAFLATILGGRGAPDRERRRSRSRGGVVSGRTVAIALLLAVLLPANAAMLLPAGTHTLGLVAAADADPNPYVLQTGETARIDVPIDNGGPVPVFVVLSTTDGPAGGAETTETAGTTEAAGTTAPDAPDDRLVVGGGETRNATVPVAAPPEPGRFDATLVEHRYLLVLPPSALASLHAIDPRLALLAVNGALAALVLGVVRVIVGFGPVRLRSSGSNAPTRVRLRRLLDGYR